MLKTITGEPRSGKTYLAVHLVLHLYYKWDPDIFQWIKRDDVEIPVILSNIDGLKIPHIRLDQVLATLKLTLPQFFTLRHFIPWMEGHGKPVIILLDEAQRNFPWDFKDSKESRGGLDPEGSTIHFFEYHGHYPIDIYLLAQNWSRVCQDIVKLSEYQISATPETYRGKNVLRYKYLDPKTMNEIDSQRISKDPRVFMAYRSSSGEYRTNQPRPVRKLIIMIMILIGSAVGLSFYLIHRIMPSDDDIVRVQTKQRQQSTSKTLQGIPAGQLAAVPVRSSPAPQVKADRPSSAPVSIQQPLTPETPYAQVKLGGAWVGKDLIAIDFFGTLVQLRDFPYSYSEHENAVYAYVPQEVLAMAKPGLWVDSHKVISGRMETEEDENFARRKSRFNFDPLGAGSDPPQATEDDSI
jgi:hypothetical protein